MTDIELTLDDNGRYERVLEVVVHASDWVDGIVRQSVFEDSAPTILAEAQIEPGPVKTPIRWTSERQRRFVMAQKRKGVIPSPYVRTHAVSQGYAFDLKTIPEDSTTISLTNSAPHFRFVEGINQQQWHGSAGTGWLSAADKAEGWMTILTDNAVDALETAWGGL